MDSNYVKLSGTLMRITSGKSANGPWVFGSVQPEGEKGRFDFAAFDDAATQVSDLGEGALVTVVGKLYRKQNKKTEAWETLVRADSIDAL